jgi:hypothetical protein
MYGPGLAARAFIVRMVGIMVLGGLLAACDRCGDFLPPIKFGISLPAISFGTAACKDDTPPVPQ